MRGQPEPAGRWVLLAVAAGGSFWWAAALFALDADFDAAARDGLLFGGVAAPLLLVLLVLARTGETRAARRLLRGLLDVRVLRLAHWLAVLLAPAVLLIVATAASFAAAISLPTPAVPTLTSFALLLAAVRLVVEEIVFRGFALPKLQLRWPALGAALALAAAAMAWQLPLFFVPGTREAELGVATPAFALAMARLVPLSIVLTALYNSTRGSILAPLLVHGMLLAVTVLVPLGAAAALLELALWSLLALGLLVRFGPETLCERPPQRAAARVRRMPAPPRSDVSVAELAPERTHDG